MAKKKHKKRNKTAAGWGAPGYGQAYGDGYGPGYGEGIAGLDKGLLHSLKGLAGSRGSEQFLLGAALGAAAAYVLSDEELRNKLVRMGMKLYAGIAGGFEEIKEQMADLRAEVEAEQHAE
ncbi:hypothetical protein [Rhodocyclus tenuis]|uniref:YtxH domain-containing protein n=1 Tax=Rhodocyclus tenuis TaxID=1066 RepID=A0A840G8Q7_RHOTE|nr:hypothetical protein [Rhodocyclus tenuis]MBB4248723.1 hypothetical protein [Rhodocyclus tenuis]